MKTMFSFLAVLFYSVFLFALESDGHFIKPLSLTLSPQTRALIVGISDYQDEGIPDLQFAHKDAEAFSNWLQSPAGGAVPITNIKTLLNEKATIAQFTSGIDWLLEETQEGDKVVIYFGGHGDMEAKILNQLGFLLLWDSPARSYLAGAVPVDILKQVITTLSIDKKAKVLMIADACRAGKLAGNSIIGTQLTSTNLAKQFANEQKILSCQADEYSIEGEQWGGGRGAFSYHLVNGLYGLADENNDNAVSLLEIEHFVQDKVSKEVAPLSQIPLAIGNKKELISFVKDEQQIHIIQDKEKPYQAVISSVEQRGLVNDVLEQADPSISKTYNAFDEAIKAKRFLEPAGDCADYYYELLIQEEQIKNMHHYLLRNYAAALQDDAQQAINGLLATDHNHLSQSRIEFLVSYQAFPKLLNRAAVLLGESHYIYSIIKAKEFLFKAGVELFKAKAVDEPQPEKGKIIIALLQQSLAYEPSLPATHFFMAQAMSKHLNDQEGALFYTYKANELASSWIKPFVSMTNVLVQYYREFEQSKILLDKATAIDSTNASVWKGWAAWYYYNKQIPEALVALEKAKFYNPNDRYIYEMIGKINYVQIRNKESEEALLKSIQLDPEQYEGYYMLGAIYYRTKQFDLAEENFLKAIAFDPAKENGRTILAFFYRGFKKYDEAISQLEELLKYTDPSADTYFDLCTLWALKEGNTKALEYLEMALQKGFQGKTKIEESEELAPLRKLDKYQQLMKIHFK